MAAKVLDENLPSQWSTAVTSDGRVFFIDDELKLTTWLHPVSKLPVQTGHQPQTDLPQGWEKGITMDGKTYYIDHNRQQTSLVHPVTGRWDLGPESQNYLSEQHLRPENITANPTAISIEHRKQASKRSNVDFWVKGPSLKKPDPSSITHKGWLYKQGSDGLQLWKRRWFVLSNYCLYYYKGTEEDKVLGYLPLPSFRIMPPGSDDRVYKRFAFKVEHPNSRAYYFAAETKTQMTKWMNLLSLSSILEIDSSCDSQARDISNVQQGSRLSSVTSSNSPIIDDSDSGFDGYRSKRSRPPLLADDKSFDFNVPNQLDNNTFEEGNLYSIDNRDRLNTSVDSYLTSHKPHKQPFYANAPPKPKRLNTSYDCSTPDPSSHRTTPNSILDRPPSRDSYLHPNISYKSKFCPNERRTPEAYGATSNLERGDYEDVFGDTHVPSEKRHRRRDSLSSLQSSDRLLLEELNAKRFENNLDVASRFPSHPISRPHSADFLEYERRHGPSDMWSHSGRADTLAATSPDVRPKSSVGCHDGDFWSEENYAAKMRQSAIHNSYLQNGNRYRVEHKRTGKENLPQPQGPRIPPAGSATPDIFVGNSDKSIDSKMSPVDFLSHGLSIAHRSNVLEDSSRTSENSFTRSASARLPRKTNRDDTLNSSYADDGSDGDRRMQQREESMKRLLEWKQRMLQSPLTRKSQSRPESSASSNGSFNKNNRSSEFTATSHLKNTKSTRYKPQTLSPESTQSSQLHSATKSRKYNEVDRSSEEIHTPRRKDTRNFSSYECRRQSNGKMYYSCSSDDDQYAEDKGSRKKVRKSPKKVVADSNKNYPKTEVQIPQSHDYVNIDALPPTNVKSETTTDKSLRAEPIFIDDDGECKSTNVQSVLLNDVEQSFVSNEPYFAQRDPYYVSDVQMPSKIEVVRNISFGHGDNEKFVDHSKCEVEYENTVFHQGETSQYLDNSVNGLSNARNDWTTQRSEVESATSHSYPALRKHTRDDSSSGKCSDSGYDTLRQEGDNFSEADYRNFLNGSNYRDSNDIPNKFSVRKSETWGPERFEKARSFTDLSSRLDESEVVREYSYEYITADDNDAKNLKNKSNLSLSLKLSSPNLASLESPKMVQETQYSSTSHLVRQRIQSFSSMCDLVDDEGRSKSEDCDTFRRPLSPMVALEAKVSSIKTESTADYPSRSHGSNQYNKSEEIETSNVDLGNTVHSPDHLSFTPTKIRKFVFNENSHYNEDGHMQDFNSDNQHGKSASVKKILKSFEHSHPDSQSGCIRKNLNSNFESDQNNIGNQNMEMLNEHLPPPPEGFLQEMKSDLSTDESNLVPPPRPPKNFRNKPVLTAPNNRTIADDLPKPTENNSNQESSWYETEQDPNVIKPSDVPMDLTEINVLVDGPPKEPAPPPPKPSSESSNNGSKLSLTEIEQTYLPMSTPKKLFPLGAPSVILSSSNSSLSSKHLATPEPSYPLHEFGSTELEEHTYIEMPGESKTTSTLSDKFGSNLPNLDLTRVGETVPGCPESPRYYEIGERDGQLYEYISKGGHYESIYMEVPGSNKIDTEEIKPEIPKKPRHLKNNTLKCSSDSALLNTKRHTDSGSSSDDDAHGDLSNIELPRKPRFSLSDTFRPASYYLSGVDPAIDPDAQDSSDSDLVSPPPIPMNSVRLTETNHLDMKLPYKSELSTINESSNYVQFDGKDHPLQNEFPENEAIGSHHRSDSISSNVSDRNKRRPITDGLCLDIENEDTFVLKSEEMYPSNESYDGDLNSYPSKTSLWSNRKLSHHESDVSLLVDEVQNCSLRSSSALSLTVPYRSRSGSLQSHHRYSDDQSGDHKSLSNLNISNNSSYNYQPASPRHWQHDDNNSASQTGILRAGSQEHMQRCNSITSILSGSAYEYNPASNRGMIINHQRSVSDLSNRSYEPSSSATSHIPQAGPVHVRSSSNASAGSECSPRTAPYYYSDVIRTDMTPLMDEPLSISRTRSNQLNNQRDLEGNKRQDIGRKVNQITDQRSQESLISRELQNSFDYFDGKTIGDPDERNVYQSDTLRKMRARTPDPDNSFKNIYPYGISVKSDDEPTTVISHRRTRSLEGMIEERPQNWMHPQSRSVPKTHEPNFSTREYIKPDSEIMTSPNINMQQYVPDRENRSTHSLRNGHQQIAEFPETRASGNNVATYAHNCDPNVDDWEDDSQWREQLRRASLRHTRSMEALDEPSRRTEIYSPSFGTGPALPVRQFEKKTAPASPKSLDEYLVDYREGRVTSPSQQLCKEGSERVRQGLTTLDEYEWDAIEEKFRKADFTCNSRSANVGPESSAFLAEGLSPPIIRAPEGTTTESSSIYQLQEAIRPPIPKDTLTVTNETTNGFKEERGSTNRNLKSAPPVSVNYEKVVSDEQHPSKYLENSFVSKPDVIPQQDVVKLGEVLPKRADFCVSQQASSETNSNYGFGSNYPTMNRNYQPHQHNSHHHYKNDELSDYNRTQYSYEDRYYDHTYQNFRNDYTGYNGNPDVNKVGYRSDYSEYYNTYANTNNSPYNYNDISHSNDTYLKADLGYEPFSETESTLPRRKNMRYGRYPISVLRDRHRTVRERHSNPYRSRAHYNTCYNSYRPKNSQKNILERPQAPSDLYEPQKLLGGVSAGELLGKTHEELVLLLIQLRRHQSALLTARRHTAEDKEKQTELLHVDTEGQEEHIARITYLEEHLLDLDKQYQMGKPLINLVDNMVKLGSLYRGSYPSQPETKVFGTQDSLEFSRRMLEKRILEEDRMQLDSVTPDQTNLEEKVMQLYKLEKKLQEESLSIQDLQRKKDVLERTLEDLNHYPHIESNNIMEYERVNQRNHLERELSSLRSHLAVSARRLEETATENNRLEHEMMMLRQKIQTNMARNLHRNSLGTDESHHIESEMLRVQSLLEELQKRRMDLSQQIQRLTANQNKEDEYGSPTNTNSLQRRKLHSTWMETDLDKMVTKDRASDIPELLMKAKSYRSSYDNFMNYSNMLDLGTEPNDNDHDYMKTRTPSVTGLPNIEHYDPVYSSDLLSRLKETTKTALNYGQDANDSRLTDNHRNSHRFTRDRNSDFNKPDGQEQEGHQTHIDINDADDRTKRFYGILPKEKPLEPRTVRVVKRESTERKRDRYPSSKKDSELTYVAEDEMESDNSDTESPDPLPKYASKTASLPRNYGRKSLDRLSQPKSNYAQNALARPNNLPLRSKPNWKSKTNDDIQGPSNDLFGSEDSPPSIFKSEAAQEIVKEMTWETEKHKRSIPKEKRRHFTISSSKPTLEAGGHADEGARSRDDCDMIRALRPRNHPDVVKSTLSTKDLRINETTIDNIFGAPDKISIPERYMPDEDDDRKLTVAERLQREQKALSIRKMLTESATSITKDERNDNEPENKSKLAAERKEREHILSMNQILAKQVMEKSRLVAVASSPEPEYDE